VASARGSFIVAVVALFASDTANRLHKPTSQAGLRHHRGAGPATHTVALDTGLRRGELIGLQWGDIDLPERMIDVRRSISSHDDPSEALTTKTDAGERLVPILDGAQAALETLFKSAPDTSDDAPVFATIERKPGRDGVMRSTGRPLNPRMVTSAFRKFADTAELPPPVRPHDPRHTAITSAIEQGEDIQLISAIAGHARTSITVDTYGHLMPRRVQEAARRIRSVASGGDRRGATPRTPSRTFPANDDGQRQAEAEADA
jgi:integrase